MSSNNYNINDLSMEDVFDEQCLSINRKKSAVKGQGGGKTRKTLQRETELAVS